MALKINIKDKIKSPLVENILRIQGVEEIYIKVLRYGGEGSRCRFSVGFFNLKDVHGVIVLEALSFPEMSYEFQLNQTGNEDDVNVVKQAYSHLMTLIEYSNCEIC